jgi:hypothetical protein
MSRAKRFLLIALIVPLVLLVFAALAPKTAHGFAATLVQVVNTVDTRIVNTTPIPVAPQGPVDVSGSSVHVASAPPVTFSNDATSPLQVSDEYKARNAVQMMCQVSIAAGSYSGATATHGPGCWPTFSVPSGKRLVITHASFDGSLPVGQFFTSVQLAGMKGNYGAWVTLVPTVLGSTTDTTHVVANQPQFVVVDSGGVGVLAYRSASEGTALANFTISGYLVDCSSGCN